MKGVRGPRGIRQPIESARMSNWLQRMQTHFRQAKNTTAKKLAAKTGHSTCAVPGVCRGVSC